MTRSQLLSFLSGWPRRAAAMACLLGAAGSLLSSHAGSVRLTPVVVASHPVAAGHTLQAADVREAHWPAASVPATAARSVSQVVGQRLASPVEAGLPVTAAALMQPAMARALAAGHAATTVSLSDAHEVSILRPGSYVDLYPAQPDAIIDGSAVRTPAAATPAASGVLVLSVLPAPDNGSGQASAALVVAAPRPVIASLTSRAGNAFLATLVQPP
ncbi:MAG TPA: SAF domain-containing protein [Jatrophihabitans sp.]|nr:SAF domain-containing protein [Jatrophihabitans sp.]